MYCFALRDCIRERCIGSVPGAHTPHLRTSRLTRVGLFPSRSFIDQYICSRAGERPQQFLFERVVDALFRIVANAEADRDVGGYGDGRGLIAGLRILYVESFRDPPSRQLDECCVAVAAIGSAFEKEVLFSSQTGSNPSCDKRESGSMTMQSGSLNIAAMLQVARNRAGARSTRTANARFASRRKQLVVLLRIRRDRSRLRKALLDSVENNARDGDICAQSDAGQHIHIARIAVARHEAAVHARIAPPDSAARIDG